MNKIKARLAPHYRGKFQTSEMIDNDIKLIKKINFLFIKIERFEKEEHILEIINIMKILNNTLFIHNIISIIYELIDVKYHTTFDCIIEAIMKKEYRESFII